MMKNLIKAKDFVKYKILNSLNNEVSFSNGIFNHYGFMNWIILPVTMLCLWMIGGCVSMAPVNSSFESAKTLGKGNVELMGSYSAYKMRYEEYDYNGESNRKVSTKVNDNFGFRLGCGVSNKVDFKIRYERMIPALQEDKDYLSGVNFFAFTTRCSFWENYITGAMDIGLYGYKEKGYDDRYHIFFFSPKIAFSYPSGKHFDLTLTNKWDIYPIDGAIMMGLNLGCGVSSDMDKWSLRPEIGLMKDLSDFDYSYFTGGIALIVQIHSKKSAIKP